MSTGCKGFIELIRDMHDTKFIIQMETHAKGERASRIVTQIGLEGLFVHEARGHSRGLWCM